ncbi:MAG: fatty acid desaturase [Proteobacteria bacterium]|nr:fatty acid desaturase [Pseudomonadota bacterium]
MFEGREIEWPTLALVALCYGVWMLATTVLYAIFPLLGFVVLVLAITLHSSLQHEVLHGHPFGSRALNEALVFFPIGLAYPYGRFRDLHLAHHRDEFLTDPYDDPESNFLDPKVWAVLPRWKRVMLCANNTLLGRMLIGPALSVIALVKGDTRAILAGDRAILRDWVLHLAGMVPVTLWLRAAEVPWWLYLIAAYLGLSILKIRTFLEHRAHEMARGRSVVVEGQGLMSFLFLNNSFHVVHHAKPKVAWYRLPALYAENREEYLRRNDGYRYGSYGEIFRKYLFRTKDPVPHPLRPQG